MNRRVLARGGAFVAASALLATSLCEGAMAASKVELAKNIDDFTFKTVAYKTEATTDGGYIVGGKTVVCLKSPVIQQFRNIELDSNGLYTIVDLEQCSDYSSEDSPTHVKSGDEDDGDSEESENADTEQANMTLLFDELCNSNMELASVISNATAKGVSEGEQQYQYNYSCVDYMAKYTSEGKSVWATPILDRQQIFGVGESDYDYRLMTVKGDVYVFEKDTGNEDSFRIKNEQGNEFDGSFYSDGELLVNKDGSMIIYDDGDLFLMSKTGNFVREFKGDSGWTYTLGGFFGNLMVSGGKVLTWRQEVDENGEYGDKSEIVEISSDLKTVTKRLDATDGSIEDRDFTDRIPMGGNQGGDMIVLSINVSESEEGEIEYKCQYESYDKNNTLIGTLDMGSDVTKAFFNGYVAQKIKGLIGGSGGDEELSLNKIRGLAEEEADENEYSKIEYYTRTLKYVGSYTPASTEEINDYTVLNNGTLVAVGATQEENSPNGLRAHLAGATVTTGQTADPAKPNNPATVDNVQLVAIMGSIAALGAAIFTRKKLVRR